LPLLDKLFRGIFGMVGEAFGLDALRRAEITSVAATWQLANARASTQDMRVGGMAGSEPVSVYAAGSVGLDGTLDFTIEPELSEQLTLDAPNTKTLVSSVLKLAGGLERLRRMVGRHHLTGTIKDPDYRFEFGRDELFKKLMPTSGNLLQGVVDTLFGQPP
jgi:hypothetical protein